MNEHDKQWLLSVAECAAAMARGECVEVDVEKNGTWSTKETKDFRLLHSYRIAPKPREPQWRPFNCNELVALVGRVVIDTRNRWHKIISAANKQSSVVSVGGGEIYHTSALLEQFTFADGSRCGVLE